MASSYYDVLGIGPIATADELRRAYRRAVKHAHPDTGGTAEAFAKVQDAWAVLGHPERRAAYDTRNHKPAEEPKTTPGPASSSREPSAAPPPAAAAPPRPPSTSELDEQVITESADPPAPANRPLLGRRTLQGLCLAGAVVSGGLTTWVISDMGRPITAAAALYLLSTGVVVGLRMAGKTTGEGTYRRLVRAAWILAGGLTLIGLLSWAMHRSPWPPLIWSACVAVFAASITGLWVTAPHPLGRHPLVARGPAEDSGLFYCWTSCGLGSVGQLGELTQGPTAWYWAETNSRGCRRCSAV